MAKQQPESRTERFNRIYGRSIKKESSSTNDLSRLGEILRKNTEEQTEKEGENEMVDKEITKEMREELNALGMDDTSINGLSFDAATEILKDKREISAELNHITDTQKITKEMREGLNVLGMDDETINGLSFNEALGILKDREEISEKLDSLSSREEPELHFHESDMPPAPKPHEKLDWIDEKVRDYEGMKAAGNADIKTITPDKTSRTFTTEVDNGTVTYTAENEVTITKESSYKVFDTVMKEPSNVGKTIRIPEDATPEFKTNLFVAAVLNGHPVNSPEDLKLDSATLEKIGLNPEQKAKVLAALPKKEKTEEKPEDKKTEEITEEKIEVSKEVQEAIAKMDESKAKLAEIIKDGKVTAAITTNPDTKKSEISFNHDPAKGGVEADATEANKLLSEAIKTLGALRKDIPEDKKAAEQVVLDNYTIKAAQLDLIRSVYQPEQSEAVRAMDRIRAKKLGLTDGVTYKYVKDKKGHLIRNKKGELVEDKYQKDESGKFVKDKKGHRVVDKNKQVEALTGTEHDAYQSKLSPAVLARVKAEYEGK